MIEINEDQMIGLIYRADQVVFTGADSDDLDMENMTDQLYAQMMGWA